MEIFDIFLGWPRQYNYWDKKRGRWHRVGGSYISRKEAEVLFRRSVPFGVTKCFGDMGDCQHADVFTIEVDAPCGEVQPSRDRLRCVAEHSRDVVEAVADMKPLLYWNGGKSLYIIFPFDYPVLPTYIPRSWVKWLIDVFPNIDGNQLSFNTTFRVPLTPHPKFKHRGEFLDEDLRPASFYIRKIPPTYVVEPPKAPHLLDVLQKTVATKNYGHVTKRLPRWVVALIEHLRQTGVLCHYARVAVVRWMYFLGYSREEIIEVFKAAADYKERKTAYHVDYEIRRMGEECRAWQPDKCKEKPWRCATVVSICSGEKMPPNLEELCPKATAVV